MGTLREDQIEDFINKGYVQIENAFSRELADEALSILWKDTGCDPNDSSTWTKPVVRLGQYTQESFRKIANTPTLHDAFDQLVGKGRWTPRGSLGSFPVRFPSDDEPNDTGWHVDASFPGADINDYFSWRINVKSKGRALLMLFLFSDVTELDAPTRIGIGSHLEVAKILEPYGDTGLTFMELAGKLNNLSHETALATGEAGTVYLCHPFISHAAQTHRGTVPRFMAQPPLSPSQPFQLNREDAVYSPVEIAIRKGVGLR